MDISIVIPNYNGKTLLENNLPKVIEAASEYKNGKVQIIVVDDNSQDESVAFLQSYKNLHKKEKIQVEIITSKVNRGFSGNVNEGVKNVNGDVIVLLNTDVVPQKNFLSSLMIHFSNENIFAVGCMDESIENGKVINRGRGIGLWKRGFMMHQAGLLNKSNTLWVSAGSGAFRTSYWKKLGGLQELYNPFYWEDIDLSYRALKAGFSLVFERKSVVVHEHGKGSIKSQFLPSEIKKIAYRNQLFFVWLNITDKKKMFNHILWLPFYLFKSMVFFDFDFIAGFLNSLLKIKKVIQTRNENKKIFKKNDEEIFLEFAPEFVV